MRHNGVDKHRDRRKSMPADSVYASIERRHHGDKRKKKQHAGPMIVVTDCACSPEADIILSMDDHNDQDGHDAKASYHYLDGLQHGGSKKSVDSVARGSHHYMDHDARGSHQHLDQLHHVGGRRGSHHYTDHHDHDTEELTTLYDMAIQTVASANEFAFTQVQDVHKRAMPNWKDETKIPDAKQMDLSSLQELETLLKDARQYNTRKQKESDYGLHTAENRQQRRRLQFLEEILQALSDNHGAKFDPMEMLQCGYLRLSKSNVERLEHMVRESGVDPGIHAHSDVLNEDIWNELRELRQKEALEREQLEKEVAGRKSRHSARRGSVNRYREEK
ncbi:hypothetical protein KP79_PYT14132 [Mizuhopecten yessoensis]|uniref:Uncharacterized protein n=1 Tax=Mizuhopecten yessoensis TaxID=6573 RepID=A0A210PE12_MIZYE|nr:hypothetical protein KP79_PYT14132 [Mizuhopecten yessoensis]